MTKAQFTDLWILEKALTWGEILGSPDKSPVRVFTRSDACGAAETWAAFMGKRQEDLAGIGVYGDPGLADAARRDPLALGYNNVNFAYDAKTLRPVDGLAVVPIDLDGDRVIGPAENFYATRDDITAAIADKRYPSPPARDLYLVTKGRPVLPGRGGVSALGADRRAEVRSRNGLHQAQPGHAESRAGRAGRPLSAEGGTGVRVDGGKAA